MQFKKFLGNEKIKEQLSYLLAAGRLPHVIVLEGEEGIGKKTLAMEIASALVCRSGGEKPCGYCAQCSKAEKGYHPDIMLCGPEDGKKFISVGAIRDIINNAYIAPLESDYKIYIIDKAHCMNESAQNAILKMLEEPPSYVVFILTVEARSMLLETVLSRAVVLSVDGVSEKIGADYITANCDADYDTAKDAVTAFKGNIGKAMASIAGGEMQKLFELVNAVGTALMADNEYELIKALGTFGRDKNKIGLISVLAMLKTVFRDALVLNKTGECVSGRKELARALRNKYTDEKLFALYNETESIIEMADKNANNALLLTKICSGLRKASGR